MQNPPFYIDLSKITEFLMKLYMANNKKGMTQKSVVQYEHDFSSDGVFVSAVTEPLMILTW